MNTKQIYCNPTWTERGQCLFCCVKSFRILRLICDWSEQNAGPPIIGAKNSQGSEQVLYNFIWKLNIGPKIAMTFEKIRAALSL